MKNRTRLFSILLSIIIMIPICLITATADNADFKVVLDAPQSVNVGDEFTVSVKVPGGFILSSCRVMVVFDEAVLEIVDAKKGSFISIFTGAINKDYNKNGVRGVRTSFAGTTNTTADGGEVLSVTFKAKAKGNTIVKTADCNFYNPSTTPQKYTYEDDEKIIAIGTTEITSTQNGAISSESGATSTESADSQTSVSSNSGTDTKASETDSGGTNSKATEASNVDTDNKTTETNKGNIIKVDTKKSDSSALVMLGIIALLCVGAVIAVVIIKKKKQ